MKMDAARAGYLRQAPGPSGEPIPPSGAQGAMWRKLSASGMVSEWGGRFRRTEAGHAALAAFDDALAPASLEVLRSVCAGGYRPGRNDRGIYALIAAGLVLVEASGTVPAPEGRALAERRLAGEGQDAGIPRRGVGFPSRGREGAVTRARVPVP